MSKRSIEESSSSSAKKIKMDNDATSFIPEDVWTQNIFQFINGNELFRSTRLVSSVWNSRVLATRCDIQVYFPNFDVEEVGLHELDLIEEITDKGILKALCMKFSNTEKHFERVKEFIASGEAGQFKSISTVTFKSKIHPSFFEKIFNLDWQSLKTLNMTDNYLSSEGIKFLADGNMKNLTSLNLANNIIGNEGIEYLSKSSFAKGLTSLKVFGNQIEYEGAQYLISNNLSGLTELNYQSLSSPSEGNQYLAMTDHFCKDTPFTIHTFANADDVKDYLFNYYTNYWKHYAGEQLGLTGEDGEDEDEDEPNVELLKEKIYPLPFGRIAGLAVGEVGGMVFNECEREAVVGIVYGQEIDEENFAKSNDSTPFVILEKKDGYDHRLSYIIGKSRLIEKYGAANEEDEGEEDEDEEDEDEEKEQVGGDIKTLKIIRKLVNSGREDDDGEDCLFGVFIGEIVDEEFVELKKRD